MLEKILTDNADLFIDGINEIIRQGEVKRSIENELGIRTDIDFNANLNFKEGIFTINFKYRSYPSGIKPE